MNDFNVDIIDFKSTNAAKLLTISLKNTGFAVLKNHDLNIDLINSVYSEWSSFFDSKYKFNYKFDLIKQDGYFPMRSENAVGYSTKDLKEFFHYFPYSFYKSHLCLFFLYSLFELILKLMGFL